MNLKLFLKTESFLQIFFKVHWISCKIVILEITQYWSKEPIYVLLGHCFKAVTPPYLLPIRRLEVFNPLNAADVYIRQIL
jgi:hypothetical protein